MTADDSNDIYTSGDYLARYPTWHAEDSAWKSEHIIRMLEANGLQPGSICEVGCGAGEILRQMSLAMPDTTQFDGYEISPQAYDIAKAKANERLRFHHQNFLETTDDVHDLLLVIDVFEHVKDYMGFLSSLKHKASHHIFHIPLDMTALSVLRVSPIMQIREQGDHWHYFSKDTALATLRDCGYEILDHFYTYGGGGVPSKRLSSRIMAMARKMAFAANQDAAARTLAGFGLMVLTR